MWDFIAQQGGCENPTTPTPQTPHFPKARVISQEYSTTLLVPVKILPVLHFEPSESISTEMSSEDRVFVLVGSTARLIPQKDEQILGPANVINISIDPKSDQGRIPLTYCGICGVSWLVGEMGPDAAASHPSHHTLVHVYSGTARSLVVL